jgi:hypothetical protein
VQIIPGNQRRQFASGIGRAFGPTGINVYRQHLFLKFSTIDIVLFTVSFPTTSIVIQFRIGVGLINDPYEETRRIVGPREGIVQRARTQAIAKRGNQQMDWCAACGFFFFFFFL